MFDLPKKRQYCIPSLVKSTGVSLKESKKELERLTEQLVSLRSLYDDAEKAHLQFCDNQGSPVYRRIFNTKRRNLRVYHTPSVIESDISSKTYGQVKDEIDNLVKTVESKNKELGKLKKMANTVLTYSRTISEMTTVTSEKTVVNCAINWDTAIDDEVSDWHDLKVLLKEDRSLVPEMYKQNFMICLVIQIVELYPASWHETRLAGKRIVYQQMYFYLPPVNQSDRGCWWYDTVGNGNYDDFVDVDFTRPYESIHASEFDYLNTMFNWFVNTIGNR